MATKQLYLYEIIFMGWEIKDPAIVLLLFLHTNKIFKPSQRKIKI